MASRTPSGNVKKPPIEKTIPPALWGRLKALNDPMLSTELGRLVYEGHLTRPQAEVGWRIGDVYQRWQRSQRLKTSAKSANLESGFSGGDEVAEERLTEEQRKELEIQTKAIEERFKNLDKEISCCPPNLRQAVLDVCVYNVSTNPAMFAGLRLFLSKMAHFFAGSRAKPIRELAQQWARSAHQTPAVAQPAERRRDLSTLAWRNAVRKVLRKVLPKASAGDVEEMLHITVGLRELEEMRLRKAPVNHA